MGEGRSGRAQRIPVRPMTKADSAEVLAVTARAFDRDGMVAYTETQKEANVSWYARAGFGVTHEVRLPGTPTVWCLRREPST